MMKKLQYNNFFDEFDEDKRYWTDGKNVYHRQNQLKGTDIESFEHLHGIWAKDKKAVTAVLPSLKMQTQIPFKL